MLRFLLFFGVNIALILMITFMVHFFGLQPYLQDYGLNYQFLAIFCLLWGMGGSFISLLISRWSAKKFMRVQLVDESGPYAWYVQMTYRLARKAKLPKMPEVGVFPSEQVNAFATGPSKKRSLVAASTGLLETMTPAEVEGVIGHEIAHIANGDMVTMTLLQGVINAFVMFLARIAAFFVMSLLRGNSDRRQGHGWGSFILIQVFQILFGFLGMIITSWFSRYREFRADKGGAQFAGRDKMIAALEKLQSSYETLRSEKPAIQSLQISSKGKFLALFSTHPPLEKRIKVLRGLVRI